MIVWKTVYAELVRDPVIRNLEASQAYRELVYIKHLAEFRVVIPLDCYSFTHSFSTPPQPIISLFILTITIILETLLQVSR